MHCEEKHCRLRILELSYEMSFGASDDKPVGGVGGVGAEGWVLLVGLSYVSGLLYGRRLVVRRHWHRNSP